MFSLGPRSKMRLNGVHPDLVKVVERAIQISTVDFTVLEGLRSPERQMEQLLDMANRSKGALWVGIGLWSVVTAIGGFFYGKH